MTEKISVNKVNERKKENMTYSAFAYVNFYSNMEINFESNIGEQAVADSLRLALNEYWHRDAYIGGKIWWNPASPRHTRIRGEVADYNKPTFQVLDIENQNPLERTEMIILTPNVNSMKWEDPR